MKMAEDSESVYDIVLGPLKRRHGKRGERIWKLFMLLVGGVLVVGYLALPAPWSGWVLTGSFLLLLGSPFLVLVALELFMLFAPKRHASWKLGIGPPTRLPPIPETPDEARRRLRAMNAFQFEEEVAAIFGLLGYRTEVTRKGGDFGADVLMWDGAGTKWAVQVKHYKGPVGRPKVQVMRQVAQDWGAERAMVVTISRFTKGAREYAESRGIELVNGDELVKMYLKAKGGSGLEVSPTG